MSMMKMAGRGEDGLAKAIKTTDTGILQTQLAGSSAVLLKSVVNASLSEGGSLALSDDVSNYVGKSVYVQSLKDGFAGLEISMDGQRWIPLINAKGEIARDDFTGIDGDPLSQQWFTTSGGVPVSSSTFAKINNNKMRLSVTSSTAYSQMQSTLKKPFNLSNEKIIEFEVDETKTRTGTYEIKIGISPVMPIANQMFEVLANSMRLLHFSGGKVMLNGVAYTIASPLPNQKYKIILNSTKCIIYRGGEKILESSETLSQPAYFLSFQIVTRSVDGNLTIDFDAFSLWSRNSAAIVRAGEPWIKTVSDVVPGQLRVVFQNDFLEPNEVSVWLAGQA